MIRMELEFACRTYWGQEDERRHSFRSVVSSWSSTNQIAFTSEGSNESSESTNKRSVKHIFIHIVDPDKPWDVYSFISGHAWTITALQWHPSGSYLLSVDRSGVFKLWSTKDNLINDWHCQRTISTDEKVVCFSWLGTSAKFLFADVSKDLNHMITPGTTQIFPRNKAKHPLANFCGTSRDGWLAVSATGKVCFVSMNTMVPVAKIQIDTDLQGIQAGDIAFSNDGYVILGLADGLVGSVARFYKVSLHCTSSTSVNITCSTLQTLSPYTNKSFHPYAITHIKFVYRNSGAHVLICNKGLLESCIERWDLKKEVQQVHELCQKQLSCKKLPAIKTWECHFQHTVKKHITILALPWLPVDPDKVQNYSYLRHNLILGFADGHIRTLNSCTLEIEGELKSSDYLPEQSHKPKRLKTSFCGHSDALLRLHYSPCSCCVMGLSGNGSMYLFKCQPAKIDTMVKQLSGHRLQISMALVNLLKYCMVSGWDWWDVLVVMKHQHEEIINATLRFLEQEDYKSLPHAQMSSKYLSIKAALLSLHSSSDTKVIDCYSKQFLLAVSNFFKSLIQSGDDRLTAICQQVTEIDLENLHQILNLKEFEVDTAILKTLHPLAQWVADCSVCLIGILLVQQGQETMPGISLLQDKQCIGLLKQLILLIYIWAKQFPGILPNCAAPVDKSEYLIQLFKLISKLWMVNHQSMERSELEGTASDFEHYFANHLNFLYHSLLLSPSNQGVTGKHAYLKPGEPDEYEFGRKPPDRMKPLKLLTTQYSGNIDVVRKLFLGNTPSEKLRQCTKCSGVSLLAEASDNLPEKAWEQRWIKSCTCGGAWKRVQK